MSLLATSTPFQNTELIEPWHVHPDRSQVPHDECLLDDVRYFSIPLGIRPDPTSTGESDCDGLAHGGTVRATRTTCDADGSIACAVEGDNLVVAVSEGLLHKTAGASAGPAPIQWQCDAGAVSDSVATSLAQRICEEMKTGGIATRDCLAAWLTILSAHILRTYSDLGRSGMAAGGRTEGLSARTSAKIEAYIRQHLDERIDLACLSAVANLSASHFTRAFRRRFGVSPHQYVVDLRLDRAWALAAYSTLPLEEIAHMAGFSNNSHMTATMRRARGVTPSQVRRGQVLVAKLSGAQAVSSSTVRPKGCTTVGQPIRAIGEVRREIVLLGRI